MVRDTRVPTKVFNLYICMLSCIREKSFAPTSNRPAIHWSNKVNHIERPVADSTKHTLTRSKCSRSRMRVFRTEDCRGRRQSFASCNTHIRRSRKEHHCVPSQRRGLQRRRPCCRLPHSAPMCRRRQSLDPPLHRIEMGPGR